MIEVIIPSFPRDQRSVWEEAAHAWRLPFWDWATTTSVPSLCKNPTVVVPTADGKGEESIPNPLFQFRMPTNKPMSSAGMDNFKDPWVDDGDTLYVSSPQKTKHSLEFAERLVWGMCSD
jgi:hypothetical protein